MLNVRITGVCAAAYAAIGAASLPALGQGPPDYDFEWARIGSPRNRDTIPFEAPLWPTLAVGSVDYRFRMSRHEVTVRQWYDFVVAYSPYWAGPPDDVRFTSAFIDYEPGVGYTYDPGQARLPISTTWHLAARYTNWLHNDKGTVQGAFESGAYDTSTFTSNPDGSRNDQLAHDPGARFWLPTFDEMIKATYHDPNRYGSGVEGYWRYPDGSDDPLIQGSPSEGGTTNGGMNFVMDVGSYPLAPTPWGILDASGNVSEWLGTPLDSIRRNRLTRESSVAVDFYFVFDRLEFCEDQENPPTTMNGIRIASSIPAPGGAGLSMFVLIAFLRRNRT